MPHQRICTSSFPHQKKITIEGTSAAISKSSDLSVYMHQNFINLSLSLSTAGVTNLVTTSGSVAGGTRCTLEGEGVKNDAYSPLSTNWDIS